MPPHSIFSGAVIDALRVLVIRIGPRATPEVMAQQLAILKLRRGTHLTAAERIGLEVFATVVWALHRHERELIAAKAAEKQKVEKPALLPVEDTTLRPVAGPLDTWGGA